MASDKRGRAIERLSAEIAQLQAARATAKREAVEAFYAAVRNGEIDKRRQGAPSHYHALSDSLNAEIIRIREERTDR